VPEVVLEGRRVLQLEDEQVANEDDSVQVDQHLAVNEELHIHLNQTNGAG
jgi:hypothetical protein